MLLIVDKCKGENEYWKCKDFKKFNCKGRLIIAKPPRFAIGSWNHYEDVLNDMQCTNNKQEEWHLAFNTRLGCSHPNVWRVIEAFKTEESISQLKMAQYVAGENDQVSKRKYRDLNERLKNVVGSYGKITIVEYLYGVASNF